MIGRVLTESLPQCRTRRRQVAKQQIGFRLRGVAIIGLFSGCRGTVKSAMNNLPGIAFRSAGLPGQHIHAGCVDGRIMPPGPAVHIGIFPRALAGETGEFLTR